MFLNELRKFSRENWWVYLLLTIALIIVYITGKGNLVEIILLFLANILGNLFIMVMQSNYTEKNNKIGSIYHIIATSVFFLTSLYGLIFLEQYQYIIWQITYSLAAIKSYFYFNYDKNITLLNEKTFSVINVILFMFFILKIDYLNFQIIQALGFSLITTGLVSIKDNVKYWLNVIGIFFLSFGSAWGVYQSYITGEIDGMALGFFILTLTVFVYYIKLLPKYLKK